MHQNLTIKDKAVSVWMSTGNVLSLKAKDSLKPKCQNFSSPQSSNQVSCKAIQSPSQNKVKIKEGARKQFNPT